jgi:alpha-amylase
MKTMHSVRVPGWAVLPILFFAIGCAAPASEQAPLASPHADLRDRVVVQLFEWTWDAVARECEEFLGPAGYAAVQVSPPSENHVVEGRPWWERYQPVSYRLETRSGDRAAFADMVSRCDAAGVEIYVDAVLNHMADADLQHPDRAFTGQGTAGSTFGSYDYPGLWTWDDFNHCGLTPNDDIQDWDDLTQVRTCELLDLSDLATGKENVQDTLAAYLKDLMSLGVKGFRFDAAKHIPPAELASILQKSVRDPSFISQADDIPWIYQEVYSGGRQSDWVRAYLPNGPMTEFSYGDMLAEIFRSRSLGDLAPGGYAWTSREYAPDSLALVFVDNHDTQRHGAALAHDEPDLYRLAQVFTLAWPYGRPRVMSSYRFEDTNAGPPDGAPRCPADGGSGNWVCEHRWPEVVGMVGFREATASARTVDQWWSDGPDRVAFSRGDRGLVVINRSKQALEANIPTSLLPGSYCNVLVAGACQPVVVGSDGQAAVVVPPMQALAIHVGK